MIMLYKEYTFTNSTLRNDVDHLRRKCVCGEITPYEYFMKVRDLFEEFLLIIIEGDPAPYDMSSIGKASEEVAWDIVVGDMHMRA